MKTLADRLKSARTESGMTQAELAKASGVKNQSTIGMLESGERKSSSFVPKISEALGVCALWLSDGRGPRYPSGKSEYSERIISTAPPHVTEKTHFGAFYEQTILPLPLHDLAIITAEQIMREATPKGRFIWIAEDDHMASGPMPSPRGHHVLIDPTAQHLHEDMVLAVVAGHRPMLRRYTEDGDIAYLVTATGALPPRPVKDDIEIIGVAITSFPPPIKRPPK